MNAAEMTYGIEIECMVPGTIITERGIRIGGYHHGIQVPGFPEGWTAQSDSSIRPATGMVAVEIVSPVLKGEDGLNQVQNVLGQLRSWGAQVNSSCGCHVHVGFRRDSIKALKRLVHLTAHYEDALYAAAGSRERVGNHYCKSIKEDFRSLQYATLRSRYFATPASNRYHVLNLTNLLESRKRTVEFRVFASTVDSDTAIAYIRSCVGLVERAIKDSKVAKWDPKPANWATTRGRGQNEALKFIYTMGWRGTWAKQCYGRIEGPALPTMEQSAEQLLRSAARFDNGETR